MKESTFEQRYHAKVKDVDLSLKNAPNKLGNALKELIEEIALEDGKIVLNGVGTLQVKSRTVKGNNLTGETYDPPRISKRLDFDCSPVLKSKLNA